MPLTLVLSVGLDSVLVRVRNLILQSAGYTVVSATSIREAADRFQNGDFDLMVLCHSVPARERERLIRLIRASGSGIPIVTVAMKESDGDHFADVCLEDRPNKLLAGIQDVLARQARIWTAWMGKADPRVADNLSVSGAVPEPQQNAIPDRKTSFTLLALAGWPAASG